MPLVIWGHFKSMLESIQTSLYCNATVTFCSLILFMKSCLIDWSKTKKSFPHWASCDTTPTYLSIYRHQDLDKICLSLVFFFFNLTFGLVLSIDDTVHWWRDRNWERSVCVYIYIFTVIELRPHPQKPPWFDLPSPSQRSVILMSSASRGATSP